MTNACKRFARKMLGFAAAVMILSCVFVAPAAALTLNPTGFATVAKVSVSTASATPAVPKFTSAKASKNSVELKWSKVKNAKSYKVYRVTTKAYWKYWKSVKKTSANKKKYADKAKYQLKVSGKNYKVYQKANKKVYTCLKTLSKCAYTFKGEYSTKYTFALKAYNGKKASAYSKTKSVTTPKKPKPKYTITYELGGGTNAPDNPAQYTQGTAFTLKTPTKENSDFAGWYTDSALSKKLSENTAKLTGNLTLYAKWHLAALNITAKGMEDMIWSWWYYPQAVSYCASNSTQADVFWGYATKQGYCGVAKYDAASGTVRKTALKQVNADDHNGLALCLLEDNRIMAIYAGGHDKNNEIHVRISDKPLDSSRFGTTVVLESRGKTSYSQIIKSVDRYYLFYRVNGKIWAYRSTVDCLHWTQEVLLIRADMQYYCKFMPTTQSNIVRVLMHSNPTAAAPEIRMGFFNTQDNLMYDGSAVGEQTKLAASDNQYTAFKTLLPAPAGNTTQRLFDCALTEPDNPTFLYAVFSKKAKQNDSVYYLYEGGKSIEFAAGGRALMDFKYPLGACFADKNTIVSAENSGGADQIKLYRYTGTQVQQEKVLATQIGTQEVRNARPIADVNGRAVLWHNGYYNPGKYTDFDTNANMYFLQEDTLVKPAEQSGSVFSQKRQSDPLNAQNAVTVNAYAQRLYEENQYDDYRAVRFTWAQEKQERGWLYYNAQMLEAFLMTDMERYSPEIVRYYDQHILKNPAAGGIFTGSSTTIPTEYKIYQYVSGELDWVLPAVGMIDLIHANCTCLDATGKEKYTSAINYVYNQLELQTSYEQCGGLLQHSEREVNGVRTPTKAWANWNIPLDGIYMSNLFLIRLAQAMDAGEISITSVHGNAVASRQIWDAVYARLAYVMEHMCDQETGLPYHAYSVDRDVFNGVSWSRGIGWYAMTLLEAAELMPDSAKKTALEQYSAQLMSALVEWQDPVTQLWYNVPNCRTEVAKNQPETSGSAMFAYCLLRGYHSGVLKEEAFRYAGLSAFNALVQTKLSSEGLTDTLKGSGVTTVPEKYQVNAFVTNEAKGVGPLIMAAQFAY